jgi:hypothetical protein
MAAAGYGQLNNFQASSKHDRGGTHNADSQLVPQSEGSPRGEKNHGVFDVMWRAGNDSHILTSNGLRQLVPI